MLIYFLKYIIQEKSIKNMNFNNNLFIIFFLLIFSCADDSEINLFSEECVECVEYEYPQAVNDSFIMVTLESGEYCLGDDIFLPPNSVDDGIELDQALLDVLTESGHCQYLELDDTL